MVRDSGPYKTASNQRKTGPRAVETARDPVGKRTLKSKSDQSAFASTTSLLALVPMAAQTAGVMLFLTERTDPSIISALTEPG